MFRRLERNALGRTEARCLVTLDLGFAHPLIFLPSRYAESPREAAYALHAEWSPD